MTIYEKMNICMMNAVKKTSEILGEQKSANSASGSKNQYYKSFNATQECIEILISAQQAAEEIFIEEDNCCGSDDKNSDNVIYIKDYFGKKKKRKTRSSG